MEEREFEARIRNLGSVTDFINQGLDQTNCSPVTRMQIELAVDEIFTNICMYAYAPATGSAVIRVDVDTPNVVRMTFIDSGMAYNPLEKEDPDTTLSAEKRKIGGLGIYLVKKAMDEMHYERSEGRNILTLTKRLG